MADRYASLGRAPRSEPNHVVTAIRPTQREKLPPCTVGCPNGSDIRGWISVIAQRDKLGLSKELAFSQAWGKIADRNPIPATIGRICPHPCEDMCSRRAKDGAVAINALERFLGDWALERGLRLPVLESDPKPERIGVIGSGPSGLSFAYQMARRGYRVTMYERHLHAGGMLYYGIPPYRLPKPVLNAEIQRILDLGVQLELGIRVGRDIGVDEIRARHSILFLGIGAQRGRHLGIPGEDGPGVWTGTAYLERVNLGLPVSLGENVVVVGGGNTAVDAARAARRVGGRVTVLYRRTREDMPAINSEIDDALREEIEIRFLVAPVRILRAGSRVEGVVVRRMCLEEPDSSGRRAPVPVAGSDYVLSVDSLITAVSQEPDWDDLGGLRPLGGWKEVDDGYHIDQELWAGGDVVAPDIAGMALAQGRRAAEAVHRALRGSIQLADEVRPRPLPRLGIRAEELKLDLYEDKSRTILPERPVSRWLTEPDLEIRQTIREEQFLDEVSRCFSCGMCFGCERCWMYCNPGCFVRLQQVEPGTYYALLLDRCEDCGKCVDVCPCGFLIGES